MTTETEEIIALLERNAAKAARGYPHYVLDELLHEARQLRRAAELLREKDALEARIAAAPVGYCRGGVVTAVGLKDRVSYRLLVEDE